MNRTQLEAVMAWVEALVAVPRNSAGSHVAALEATETAARAALLASVSARAARPPSSGKRGRPALLQVQDVAAMAAEGVSLTDAATRLGVAYSTVAQFARRNGIAFARPNRAFAVDSARRKVFVDDLRRMASEGVSQAKASVTLGVSRERVRQLANKHGIAFVRGGVDTGLVTRVGRLHAEGVLTNDMCAALGLSRRSVVSILKRLDLTPNDPPTKTHILRIRLAEGARLTDVAREIGWSVQSTYTVAHRLGIMDYKGRNPRKKPAPQEASR